MCPGSGEIKPSPTILLKSSFKVTDCTGFSFMKGVALHMFSVFELHRGFAWATYLCITGVQVYQLPNMMEYERTELSYHASDHQRGFVDQSHQQDHFQRYLYARKILLLLLLNDHTACSSWLYGISQITGALIFKGRFFVHKFQIALLLLVRRNSLFPTTELDKARWVSCDKAKLEAQFS